MMLCNHDLIINFTHLSFTRRNNKYFKGLVRSPKFPEVHLAKSVVVDVATAYIELSKLTLNDYDIYSFPQHRCIVTGKEIKSYIPTARELEGLARLVAGPMTPHDVHAFPIARIMGVHFRAGEWGLKKCGSVITCVMNGRSVYGHVRVFFRVNGDHSCPGYASVKWFSCPEYPQGTPMVVSVTNDDTTLRTELGHIIRVTKIDPSAVPVEPIPGRQRFYMMRLSGYDTIIGP